MQHHCEAYITTGPVTLTASSSHVVLPLNGTMNVRGTNPYNTSTKRFMAATPGMYMFAAHWILTLPTATLNTQIFKNGTLVAYVLGGQLTHVLYLSSTDYVEVYVRHAESTTQYIDVGAYSTFVTRTML